MKIIVGSTNPVKINAVKKAVESVWRDAEVSGVETDSGVSAQPRTDEETHQGSINRAKNALQSTLYLVPSTSQVKHKHKKSKVLSANDQVLGIGLEGGVFETENGEMWNTVWATVVDSAGNVHSVNGSRFLIPEVIAEGIRAGEEMGTVADRVAGVDNIHHKQGFIGYMTHNVVDRTSEYSNLVKLAVGLLLGRTKA